MRSAFFGLHVASSGLHTARANMNVSAHNIANAEIRGFSRQVATARAAMPLDLRDGRGMYGTGSQVTGIVQIRNHFLDRKFWNQRGILGEHTAKATHLNFVETVFNNLPDAGLLRTFGDFFGTISNLITNAEAPTFRTAVIGNAQSTANMIQHQARTLQRQQTDLNREISDVVSTINSLGTQIARLNNQIHAFERDGTNANDLRDQRAVLIDELSKLVNIEVDERDFSRPGIPNDTRLGIRINGQSFINHDTVIRLELEPRTSAQRRNEMDADGLYDIRFANGSSFNMHSSSLQGVLKGLIDVRDGNNSVVTEQFVAEWPRTFNSVNGEWDGQWIQFPAGFDPNNPPPGFQANDPGTWPAGTVVLPNSAGTFMAGQPQAVWPMGTMTRPGTTTNFKGIPFYMNQLNNMVRTFARAMNEGKNGDLNQMQNVVGHIYGFDANGNNLGTLFFTSIDHITGDPAMLDDIRKWILDDGTFYTGPDPDAAPAPGVARDDAGNPLFTLDYSGFNALNFSINPDLLTDPSLLAASSNHNEGQANNNVILGFATVGQDRSLFREGSISDFIIAVSNHLAVDTRQSMQFRISFEEITLQTENHRLSVSGVDTDEEMMNLLRFQHMFTAASRLVNVLDTIYDTLINRLGNM